MKCVLFLCTGNFYRSRFAETFFNHRAAAAGLGWRAESRGLATQLNDPVWGPISPHTLRRLEACGIACPEPRWPASCEACDLERADRIIALKELEHRPLLERQFPALAGRVEYWHVNDLDSSTPDEALAQIERHIIDLLDELSNHRN
jgi:protein-tyrosine phosphatase